MALLYICCPSAKGVFRDVAQSGLEYTSGGRGVASSNLVIPTEDKKGNRLVAFFHFNILVLSQ